MKLQPLDLSFGLRTCRTRLPFRFGIATMTEAPMLTVRVRAGTEDGEAFGYSAELLVPKWFAKDPGSAIEDDNRDLIAAARAAFDVMAGTRATGTVFGHWLRAQQRCVEDASVAPERRLVAMFGVSLIERALIDAVCRASGRSFDAALRDGLFGLRLGEVEPRLDGWTAASLDAPPESVRVRHTVGLVDALEDGDVPDADRRGDDHPLSLAADIAAYGLDCFKLKVAGDAAADRERLTRICALTPPGSSFTLDGNEQYGDPNDLADMLDALESGGAARPLLDGLLAIEQPVHRAHTFDPATRSGVARLAERAPVIIDEADADLDAYPRARALGYGGVSMKACKGVLRALVNRARIDADGAGFQSAEDLTNLPALPLHQDLAVVATLGLPHVERNGHHYFRGQEHLSAPERAHLVARHPDLYHPNGRLRIEGGRLNLGSLQVPGFGYDGPVELGQPHEGAPR